MTTLDPVRWLREFAALIDANAAALTELDSAIGDADHGSNMRRGTAAVVAALDESAPAETLKQAGMTLIRSVGGASGPLYGTFFLRFAAAVGAGELDAAVFAKGFRAGLDGVVARGKAEPGDKTMFDALAPAATALDESLAAGTDLPAALTAALTAAEAGRDATIPLQARKGRAAFLGERSIGHQDPGATSSVLLVRAAQQALA
ncbi:dihydroxyacetone kinase subunit L [Nocardia terpenica]|uniref:dihydroxyacetone kinase subunit DhaL n=1 Tax=Nocardia terpenica TaxID=455432 RepID=UPI001894C55E|nr:dihydroxyacetone kinase subunit DhaL [Nocardia terpenica]MBF6060911.1 dihydroxyacetone kinase subunit L [Nocardia terpenica]MBF6104171.1 dihydroxyacetone kinase subunit L [Nocardia terpenica]MBF6111455.1 dihydroxyacetone kinase subunit L [Nocardia terpenica]MBF6118392.1 dihydroxyacetone kinase subunit L [Nocardia terpenica]MBF6155714.1 dihydroxyacetone kinase subunit L [Nocardia terpenica]